MSEWQPIETAPSGKAVLISYLNSCGNRRTVKAVKFGQYECAANYDSDDFAEYCEEKDEYFCPAGWYEQIDNWDEYSSVKVYQGEPTHWMPLPAPPKDESC
jgi:DNA phosphorothioation-dependent restriction protein DptG